MLTITVRLLGNIKTDFFFVRKDIPSQTSTEVLDTKKPLAFASSILKHSIRSATAKIHVIKSKIHYVSPIIIATYASKDILHQIPLLPKGHENDVFDKIRGANLPGKSCELGVHTFILTSRLMPLHQT
ncbi:hypothetical protein BK136_30440 [Paenibacillus amylolyticus]|nr:hypothetical protein BK136_30440 [Paenibacillus amylolyticus]